MATSELTNGNSSNSKYVHVNTSRLNLNNIPKILGKGPRERATEIFQLMVGSTISPYLIGDTGTGKSLTIKNLLKEFAIYEAKRRGEKNPKENPIPAYYVQLSQDDTKTGIIMGLRLIDGSLMPIDGVLAQCARERGVIAFDEITHSTQQMLLTLNSVDGNESIVSIGERLLDASGVTVLYGSNASIHAGNIRIPPSFANRIVGIPFTYPNAEEEAEISKDTAQRKLRDSTKPISVPDPVFKYLSKFVQQLRPDVQKQYPLSSRNIAHAAVLMHFSKRVSNTMDDYFVNGPESIKRQISERILDRVVNDTALMASVEVITFLNFVSSIGVEKFRECVKRGFGYYIDIDGSEFGGEAARQKIANSII
jgi:hypothetical protein